jgi:hypothetical protein
MQCLNFLAALQVAALSSDEECDGVFVRTKALSIALPLYSRLALSPNPTHRKLASQSVLAGALSVLRSFSEPAAAKEHIEKLLAMVTESFQSSDVGAPLLQLSGLGNLVWARSRFVVEFKVLWSPETVLRIWTAYSESSN